MKRNNIFNKKEINDNLTSPIHYTIKNSLLKKIKNDARKYGLSESKVVTLILEEYYKKS